MILSDVTVCIYEFVPAAEYFFEFHIYILFDSTQIEKVWIAKGKSINLVRFSTEFRHSLRNQVQTHQT